MSKANVDNYRESVRLRSLMKERQHQEYKERSKEKLMRCIQKSMQTTFIGALHAYEEEYGCDLWGHGLPDNELNSEQLEERERWKFVRDTILNNGNKQLRMIRNELENYTVEWDRFTAEFRPSNNTTNREGY